MAISTPGVGGGGRWYSGFQVAGIIKGFFGGSWSFRSLDLWGSVKVLQVFWFFLVGILMFVSSLHGMFMAWKFGMGFVWDLILVQAFFGILIFAPIQSSLSLEIRSTNNNNYSHKQTNFLVTVFDRFLYGFVIQAKKLLMYIEWLM